MTSNSPPSSNNSTTTTTNAPPTKRRPRTQWDQKCVIFLTQTNSGRSDKAVPQASMRCIQRLLDGPDGRDKTLLFKHSNDFVTIMNEAVALMDSTQSLSQSDHAAASTPVPASAPTATLKDRQQVLDPPTPPKEPLSVPVPVNTPMKDIKLHSPTSVAQYHPPKDSQQPVRKEFSNYLQESIVAPSKQYFTRIYAPHIAFFKKYSDAVGTGKAFEILGRYYDAVVIEQRPLLLGWKMCQKLDTWVKAARGEGEAASVNTPTVKKSK